VRQARFPPGWDEERVRRVPEHYESQTDEETVAEDEAAVLEAVIPAHGSFEFVASERSTPKAQLCTASWASDMVAGGGFEPPTFGL
jgi:hypothetical protein